MIPKQEFFSDNSVSLPGLMGQGGPIGFEPGMFKKEQDVKYKTDSGVKVVKVTLPKFYAYLPITYFY